MVCGEGESNNGASGVQYNYFQPIVCMAMLVPDLDLFISLSGAICMSTLSIITPALLDNVVHGDITRLTYFKNCMLVVFGCGISVFGTIISVIDLIKRHE